MMMMFFYDSTKDRPLPTTDTILGRWRRKRYSALCSLLPAPFRALPSFSRLACPPAPTFLPSLFSSHALPLHSRLLFPPPCPPLLCFLLCPLHLPPLALFPPAFLFPSLHPFWYPMLLCPPLSHARTRIATFGTLRVKRRCKPKISQVRISVPLPASLTSFPSSFTFSTPTSSRPAEYS